MITSVLALVAASVLITANAHAVSLAGRPTDDTVCDLTPMTTYRLSQKVFVPAGSSGVPEIYTRLALQFITTECRNGQALLLHSDLGNSEDEQTFRAVTDELCSTAEVSRSATATVEYPHSFQVRCRLAKIQDAKLRLAAAERSKSLQQMIKEGAPPGGHADSDEKPSAAKECSEKITFGSLLGLGGNCR
jgi:hypothetical protein